MSIKAIHLKNFRGFGDASIEIKPLTVLLGANSSGKSSFGHALAAMAHAQWDDPNSDRASLTPRGDIQDWPVDLGTLEDLRTHEASGHVFISLKTSEGWLKWGFGFLSNETDSRDLIVSYLEQPKGREETESKILASELPSATQPIAPSGTYYVDLVESERKASTEVVQRINSVQWRELPDDIETTVELRGLIINTITHQSGTKVVLNLPIRDEIRQDLQDLTYIRATRSRPSRIYNQLRSKPSRQAIGYGGERTAFVLRRRGQEELTFKLPFDIPESSYDLGPLIDREWEEHRSTLVDALAFWLRHLKLASSVEAVPSKVDPSMLQVRVTLEGQQPHDITEVGFGISQILPVLVAGLIQPKGSLFIVDLPEAHLHPRPQAELADFFCSLALSGVSVLVETHSEMFIHQLRLRTELTPQLREKIALYFIDTPKDGCCCNPQPIGLSSEKEMRWPVGFLQGAWEIETKIGAVRDARRKAIE